jgi:UDP-N-acetylglucosamine 2-epimerase (hydrolysing)
MGEVEECIHVIGSPDMDAMLSNNLPEWEDVKINYEIPFEDFGISMFHPVTTEFDSMDEHADNYVSALENSPDNYIVIYPNNDKGSDFILSKLKRLEKNKKFRVYPSVRFEAFLVMMKHASFIVGNSSAGIREAPYYGIPTVNVGTRQNGRTDNEDIIHTDYEYENILNGITEAKCKKVKHKNLFGNGDSNQLFLKIIKQKDFWKKSSQKQFHDLYT